jgi:hypothetical protein
MRICCLFFDMFMDLESLWLLEGNMACEQELTG